MNDVPGICARWRLQKNFSVPVRVRYYRLTLVAVTQLSDRPTKYLYFVARSGCQTRPREALEKCSLGTACSSVSAFFMTQRSDLEAGVTNSADLFSPSSHP